MTTDENDFDLQSAIKCCTDARVDAMDAEISRDKSARFAVWRNKSGAIVWPDGIQPFI
ncbi:MAG: hypothetical protein JO141_13570 [Bradyrhizobium sp.]|nr:hypothetical protein [Bradyrhizobium sp.]